MSDLPPPVGSTASVSRPSSTARMTSSWPGRKWRRPNSRRSRSSIWRRRSSGTWPPPPPPRGGAAGGAGDRAATARSPGSARRSRRGRRPPPSSHSSGLSGAGVVAVPRLAARVEVGVVGVARVSRARSPAARLVGARRRPPVAVAVQRTPAAAAPPAASPAPCSPNCGCGELRTDSGWRGLRRRGIAPVRSDGRCRRRPARCRRRGRVDPRGGGGAGAFAAAGPLPRRAGRCPIPG